MVTRRQFCAAPAFIRALSKSQPNLLLLMSDQHRADWMGCDGNTAVFTPALDRLASEGVRFRNAYSSTPTCTPARAGLLTGMSPWRHGMLGYSRVAQSYPAEMPRVLRGAGYYTLGIGKMHWTPQRHLHGFHQTILDESGRSEHIDFRSDYRAWFASEAPNLNPDSTGIGFNDFTAKSYVLPERLHPTRWTGDCAVRFLETYEKPGPWFMKVSFARPHSPYDPPQRYWDRYQDARLPQAQVGAWAQETYAPRSSNRDDIWHGDVGPDLVRRARVGYSGSVSFMDEQLGRILLALDKRGWMEETFIVYLSDHGDMTGDHHLWRKSYAYEPSARIPMLVRGPGAPRGLVSEIPVEIRDVLPTLAQAAGASVPEACDGQNLLSARRDWIDLEHDVCYDKRNHWTALTDGKWKYIFHAYDGSEQLFHLETDRAEMHGLEGVAGHEQTLRRWRGRMAEHLAPRGEKWVRDGRPIPRPQSMLLGPNYPAPAAK
ncbi:MAG: arylsulfatase [Candidatus Solibacter usitatus]|nr:arylsulfatase [Candidatus Solibacter usitatus]